MCWEMMVDWWCSQEWQDQHDAARVRHRKMSGPSHHQGSLTLEEYRERYEAAHPGQDIGPLGAYTLSKKGKATADITYSPDDPPEAYTNSTVHSRISSYCDSAHAIHDPDFDPYNEAISGEAAMRAGGGKQHGRYWVADPLIDSSRTPTLSQIRAKDRRQGQSSSGVRSRPTAADCIITNLQTQLSQKEVRITELETQYREMAIYMRTLGAQMVAPPPPNLYVPPALGGPSPLHSQGSTQAPNEQSPQDGGWSDHVNPYQPPGDSWGRRDGFGW